MDSPGKAAQISDFTLKSQRFYQISVLNQVLEFIAQLSRSLGRFYQQRVDRDLEHGLIFEGTFPT